MSDERVRRMFIISLRWSDCVVNREFLKLLLTKSSQPCRSGHRNVQEQWKSQDECLSDETHSSTGCSRVKLY